MPALLDRIESELATAAAPEPWTMKTCLAMIGSHFPEHRKRALSIGEKLGIYRDDPVSKGCTSPFAPIWIAEMVRRRGRGPSGALRARARAARTYRKSRRPSCTSRRAFP